MIPTEKFNNTDDAHSINLEERLSMAGIKETDQSFKWRVGVSQSWRCVRVGALEIGCYMRLKKQINLFSVCMSCIFLSSLYLMSWLISVVTWSYKPTCRTSGTCLLYDLRNPQKGDSTLPTKYYFVISFSSSVPSQLSSKRFNISLLLEHYFSLSFSFSFSFLLRLLII